ncbi:hypothetical protein BDB13_3978 [Rhodococcus sp. OK302]|nr:hypothetical protein BDB13_3978 [Rhodococcus sp. OK302]
MLPTPALPGQVRRSTALAVLSARWCEPPWTTSVTHGCAITGSRCYPLARGTSHRPSQALYDNVIRVDYTCPHLRKVLRQARSRSEVKVRHRSSTAGPLDNVIHRRRCVADSIELGIVDSKAGSLRHAEDSAGAVEVYVNSILICIYLGFEAGHEYPQCRLPSFAVGREAPSEKVDHHRRRNRGAR